jgi:hypothetical protein
MINFLNSHIYIQNKVRERLPKQMQINKGEKRLSDGAVRFFYLNVGLEKN